MRARTLAVVTLLSVGMVVSASAGPAGANQAYVPSDPEYGSRVTKNLPVTMKDGTVLRVDLYEPTNLDTGEPAPGPFPTILMQTPYGKSDQTGTYLVERGYLQVVADIRGRGSSHGEWDIFGDQDMQDGAELVDWAAQLPNASGLVGMSGASYLGVLQLKTASAVGPDSPLKAIFPVVAVHDLYRDNVFYGGVPNQEFSPLIAAITASDGILDPISEGGLDDPAETLAVEIDHAPSPLEVTATQQFNFQTGGETAWDGDYWRSRSPRSVLNRIADNDVAVFLVGGWYDLFQRGEPLNYSTLQNAFAGRDPWAPMPPVDRADDRVHLLQGPWFHTISTDLDLQALELRWFDHWLKGIDTGMVSGGTPLHLYELGADRWVDTAAWPLAEAEPTTLYFGPAAGDDAPSSNQGSLTATPGEPGTDTVAFTGFSHPCSLQTVIQTAGAIAGATGCENDDSDLQSGPGALTFTTEPFAQDRTIGGPSSATVHLTSTTSDAYIVLTLEVVAPDGTSRPITAGALLASHRALDLGRSWWSDDGRLITPHHPHTEDATQAIPAGETVTLDIDLFATFSRIPAGHRLRATLTTMDTPHVAPTATQLPGLVGGVYEIHRGGNTASSLTVSLADPAAFDRSCAVCVGESHAAAAPDGPAPTAPPPGLPATGGGAAVAAVLLAAAVRRPRRGPARRVRRSGAESSAAA